MNHDSDNKHRNNIDNQIQEIYARLERLRQNKRIVTTPKETEALEREIRTLTDQLGSLILRQKGQVSKNSEELH